MRGKALPKAIAAASRFVALKPERDRIAIVTFASQTIVATKLSSSAIDADSVLPTLIPGDSRYGTTLYDAIVLSSRMLARSGSPGRVILLVTDGQETTSKATLGQAIRAARKAHALVYTVAIESRAFSPGPLKKLARQTGGTYYGASSSAELPAIYEGIARRLSRTWRSSTSRPPDPEIASG